MHRFYLPPEAWPPSSAPLHIQGTEAHHASRVLRLAAGEVVEVFDGQGRVAKGPILQCSKQQLRVETAAITHVPPADTPTVLAIGFSKAIRRSWLLEKAVELGAAGLWFWQADRTQGRIPPEVKESWQATLVAAAKQCGAAHLPAMQTFGQGLPAVVEAAAGMQQMVLWEAQDHPAPLLSPAELTSPAPCCCILGPEGGFSEKEVDWFLTKGLQPVSLGPSTLRWETAALTMLSLRFWGQAHAKGDCHG